MTTIDISITEPPHVIENVVEVPSRYAEGEYPLVRTLDYGVDKRYECPECPNAYKKRGDTFFECRVLHQRYGDNRLCKVALNRATCPLGMRNPP